MTEASAQLLLHVFPTFAVGGAQMRFAALADAFGDRYRHIVLALDGNHDCAQRVAPNLPVRYETIDAPKQATLGNVRRFRRRLRELKPDVLVTYNWGAIEWTMANIPRLARHIHIEDGFGPEERAGQIRRRVLTRRLVLARSTVVLPSRNLWRIATGVWGLDPRRVHYVPNGIDLHRFAGSDRVPGAVPIIGTVAGLRAEKNVARLLHAFRHVADAMPARLVIAGDGPDRTALAALSAQLRLGSNVEFLGQIDNPAPLYRSFDIFALSSDTEQMPLSVIEAMASGLPIAATDVGDVMAMVAKANRAFITPLDDLSLAGAIKTLAGDRILRAHLGAANQAKAAAEFDQTTMVAAYGALFDGRAPVPA
jgi:glycosyltransferase involved in cell wall biosynthesis